MAFSLIALNYSSLQTARLLRLEINGWVREFAMKRYTEDEINNVIDIFVIECGVLTLSEVVENSAEFTKLYFKERGVKLGFASAIVKAISSLGEISEASSNLNSAEPLPDVRKNGNADYIEVNRGGAVISSGQSEVLDCDYFHNVSKIS